mgnify:CR=1 FL=1
MPDAFLSYAREDKPLAQQLVEALESRGLEVWWDDDIEGGHPNYQRAIEDALRQATAVIVLWTPASVTSDYVREEVAFARNHKKLLPVLGKPAELPVPYRLSQTIDLTAWDGSRGHPKVASIAQALTARRQGAPPEPKPVKPTRKPQWVLRKFTWLIAPTLLTVLVLVILLNWRRPTEVAITAVVSRVEFEADGETRQPLIQQLRVPSPGFGVSPNSASHLIACKSRTRPGST